MAKNFYLVYRNGKTTVDAIHDMDRRMAENRISQ